LCGCGFVASMRRSTSSVFSSVSDMADPHFQLHPQERYWMALGKYLDDFAHTESLLQTLLWAQAGTTQEVAKAVFSGARVDTAKDYIRRIAEANGAQIEPMLARAFAQLSVLTTLRNDLVHYGAPFNPQAVAWVASNRKAAMPGRERETNLTPNLLSDASQDLWTINYALSCFIRPDLRKTWEKVALAPWRYTPARQAQTSQPRRATNRGRKPPPQSS
jgi:hypothetical protein